MKIFPVVVFCFFLLTCPFSGWAQREKQVTTAGMVIMVGAPLNNRDSIRIKQLFFAGLREKMVNNDELAADLFTRILQIDPSNDAAMFELARIRKMQKHDIESSELLEKAVTVNPDNEWYWITLADHYQKANSYLKLENVYNELIRINPERRDYYFDKANTLFLQKKYDEALDVYAHLEMQTGSSDELMFNRQKIYLKQGKIDKAGSELEQLIVLKPDEIRYYLSLSELYNSNDQTDKAFKVLLRAGKVDPENPFINLALADVYRTLKNKDASFEHLKLAFISAELSIDQKIRIVAGYFPKFPDVNAAASALELSRIVTEIHADDAKSFALYGDVLVQNNKIPEAREAYRNAITLNNQIYVVWEQLVRIELSERNLDSSIRDGEEALAIFPNQAWMNYLVGISWYQKKEYEKALNYLKNAVLLETVDKTFLTQAYSSLGDCYHQQKMDVESDTAYEKALTNDQDNVYTLNNYAYYLSLRGEQLDKAAQMSKRSNELQPNSASFEDTYAWILFKQKRYDDAKTWMEKALLKDKAQNAVQMEHYGDILFHTGNIELALKQWKKAAQNGGQSPALKQKISEKIYVE
ncbi:MAG: tetratricopeptide repeat protein [Sphingobacteriaceae bacterium]